MDETCYACGGHLSLPVRCLCYDTLLADAGELARRLRVLETAARAYLDPVDTSDEAAALRAVLEAKP